MATTRRIANALMLFAFVFVGAGLAAGHRPRPIAVHPAAIAAAPTFIAPAVPIVAPAGAEFLLHVK